MDVRMCLVCLMWPNVSNVVLMYLMMRLMMCLIVSDAFDVFGGSLSLISLCLMIVTVTVVGFDRFRCVALCQRNATFGKFNRMCVER